MQRGLLSPPTTACAALRLHPLMPKFKAVEFVSFIPSHLKSKKVRAPSRLMLSNPKLGQDLNLFTTLHSASTSALPPDRLTFSLPQNRNIISTYPPLCGIRSTSAFLPLSKKYFSQALQLASKNDSVSVRERRSSGFSFRQFNRHWKNAKGVAALNENKGAALGSPASTLLLNNAKPDSTSTSWVTNAKPESKVSLQKKKQSRSKQNKEQISTTVVSEKAPVVKVSKTPSLNMKPKDVTLEKALELLSSNVRQSQSQSLSSDNEDDSSTSVMMQQSQSQSHIPVMLGEVLDVFSSNSKPLRSFVDCTLGAAGHASAIIKSHPQLKLFVGMDVDPLAFHMARSHINALSHSDPHPQFQAFTFLNNFRHIKSLLRQVDHPDIFSSGVDGILMDLGMSSMQVDNPERGFSVLTNGPLDMRMDPQACLKAEDILNSWPDTEVGRILRDYGEESNWQLLKNKILQARLQGGLHSTGELIDVIRSVTPGTRRGRRGWVKTATRVFQALRIAVNDELKTLEDSLYACFDCLAPGGRLAVISFHSLEDRIVKHAFLKIIDCNMGSGDGSVQERDMRDLRKIKGNNNQKESWIRQTIQGWNGTILTKRPITPSEMEVEFNRRSRSAKLRVIQKAYS
ncbi:hypothetical protein PTKIN_Ptkin09bG0295800 [Pterospermum kingtungense]